MQRSIHWLFAGIGLGAVLLGLSVQEQTLAESRAANDRAMVKQAALRQTSHPFWQPVAYLGNRAADPAGAGYSIHIAVEQVDESAYGTGVPRLPAVKNDLAKMKLIAKKHNFTILNELVDSKATRANVLNELKAAATKVKSGDTLLVTYAGHGSETIDTNGDEITGKDQTWCLFDGHLIDDELIDCWRRFAAGARIVVLLDSCHSSTAARGVLAADITAANEEFKTKKEGIGLENPKIKKIADIQAKRREDKTGQSRTLRVENMLTSNAIKAQEYLSIQTAVKDLPEFRDPNLLKATVMVLAACQDEQTALDDYFNGFFTKALVDVWNDGAYDKSYRHLLNEVAARVKTRAQLFRGPDGLPHRQDPSYLIFGAKNQAFEDQLPFNQ